MCFISCVGSTRTSHDQRTRSCVQCRNTSTGCKHRFPYSCGSRIIKLRGGPTGGRLALTWRLCSRTGPFTTTLYPRKLCLHMLQTTPLVRVWASRWKCQPQFGTLKFQTSRGDRASIATRRPARSTSGAGRCGHIIMAMRLWRWLAKLKRRAVTETQTQKATAKHKKRNEQAQSHAHMLNMMGKFWATQGFQTSKHTHINTTNTRSQHKANAIAKLKTNTKDTP